MLALLEFPIICSTIICLFQDAQGALASLSLANDPLADIRALTRSLLPVLFPARPPRWRPAAWSRLVMGRSRRGGPSAVTPVTASHVAAGRVTAVTASARRPGPLPLAISLTDRSLRDRRAIALLGTARLVRSSLPRFGRVAADETSTRL
jgi:hypothetical protein